MSAVDWSAQPEPWRSVGLRFIAELQGSILRAEPRRSTAPRAPTRKRGNAEVRELRLQASLSQGDLARLCNCSAGLVSHVERGNSNTNPDGPAAQLMLSVLRNLPEPTQRD